MSDPCSGTCHWLSPQVYASSTRVIGPGKSALTRISSAPPPENSTLPHVRYGYILSPRVIGARFGYILAPLA
eukprot:4918329-Pyramimonas_sp.AAC.1